MPQITINEIDQSVFTRVINDDKVKVLVPGIASFGPVYDGSEDSAVTFTDVTAFNKVFGYTEPEYNPFPDDVSRTYAKQLIDRGAAVTFVRVNNGTKATFNMTIRSQKAGETDVVNYVPVDAAIVGNEPTYTVVSTKPADWSTKYYVNYYTKSTASDGTDTYTRVPQFTLVINGTEAPSGWPTGYYTKETAGYTAVPAGTTWSATGTYYTANPVADNAQWPATTYYTMNDTYKYMFAEQIEGIEAKYTGTFGNHLLVTFSPIDSPNVVFPYQYSLVCVYRADILVKSTKTPTADGYVVKSSKVITGVHKLEDHIVTTNPNDVNYIEDVEFNYINFVLTPSARDEFAVAWSNIGNTDSTLTMISGFPEIKLANLLDGVRTYNEKALLDGAYDFTFNSALKNVLDTGYEGITINTNTKLTKANVNEYILECYCKPAEDTQTPANSVPGIVDTILNNIKNCYANYSDPYIYDFDFITSGGFINEKFTVTDVYKEDDETITNVITTRAEMKDVTSNNRIAICKSDRMTNLVIPLGLTSIHKGMRELVRTRKDCIALIDVNPGWRAMDLPQYVEYINESQCAVHAPWCKTADPFNSAKLTLMPPSFVFLYTLLSNLINSPDSQKWFPPAGVTRATARVVVKPQYEIGSVLLNAWQNDTLARVNPIMKLKNYGYVIYGQYTTYVAIDEFTHSALESLNVRLVANCVKKQIFNTCLKLAFDPNNSSLWFKFYDAMDKYLLFMKRNDGVYDYRIQMDESTVTTDDINELRCPGKVWINPTRTAEFFDIDFILTEAGVTFNEEGE